MRWLLGVNIDGLASSAFGALIRARSACRSALFRGFDSGLRGHSDDDNKAEITTLKG